MKIKVPPNYMFKLYNGCPNKELQAHLDSRNRMHSSLEQWGLRATYFPMEQGWAAFTSEHHQITPILPELSDAYHQAIQHMTK